jgi:hypothetical protein
MIHEDLNITGVLILGGGGKQELHLYLLQFRDIPFF